MEVQRRRRSARKKRSPERLHMFAYSFHARLAKAKRSSLADLPSPEPIFEEEEVEEEEASTLKKRRMENQASSMFTDFSSMFF